MRGARAAQARTRQLPPSLEALMPPACAEGGAAAAVKGCACGWQACHGGRTERVSLRGLTDRGAYGPPAPREPVRGAAVSAIAKVWAQGGVGP